MTDLESLVGRLNHAALIIPLSRHFLNRIRNRAESRKFRKQKIRLDSEEIAHLCLWQTFLSRARYGISMNLVVYRRPDLIGVSDSCPYGLGGLLLIGFAWRLCIPEDAMFYGEDAANNLLEFLAMAVNIWLAVIFGIFRLASGHLSHHRR